MSNVLEVTFASGQMFVTATRLWQGDYGQILLIHGPELPSYYEVHFSSSKDGTPEVAVGTPAGVTIPNRFLRACGHIYAWVFLHVGNTDGETKFQIKIPVEERGIPIDQETPEEQTAVQQAIAALNEETGRAEAAADRAEQSEVNAKASEDAAALSEQNASGSAEAAASSERNAAQSELDAAASAAIAMDEASDATQAANAAIAAANTAEGAAGSVTEYARRAEAAATHAEQYSDAAQIAKEGAVASEQAAQRHKNDAVDAKEAAQSAASTATQKAQAAEDYAGVASQKAEVATDKALEASLSATDASGSASNAATSETQAEASATAAGNAETAAKNARDLAQGYASGANESKLAAQAAQEYAEAAQTAAETAQDKAEDAQDAAETAQGAAEDSALEAEGYAKGTQDGTAVESGSPYYQANAKYYKEQAEQVFESIPEDYTELSEDVSDLQSIVIADKIAISKSDLSSGYYYSLTVGQTPTKTSNSNSVYTETAVDVSKFIGFGLRITTDGISGSNTRMFGFLNSEGKVVSIYGESQLTDNGDGTYSRVVTITGPQFVFSFSKNVASVIEIQCDMYNFAFNSRVDYIEQLIGTRKNVGNIEWSSFSVINQNRLNTNAISVESISAIIVGAMPSPYESALNIDGSSPYLFTSKGYIREIPKGASSATLRFRRSDDAAITTSDIDAITEALVSKYVGTTVNISSVAFVSTEGSDENEGTSSLPYATVNRALSSGAQVIMIAGGVYDQEIDFALTKQPVIELRNSSVTGRVIFRKSSAVVTTTETKENGYTKVYSCLDSDHTYPEDEQWIWQENVPDETTLIADEDRLPQQRGYEYRLQDTKIVRCTSTELEEALAEIDESSSYKWFYDSESNKLYYSRPQSVSQSYPICIPEEKSLFSNLSRNKSLKAYGIECKYMSFDVSYLSSVELYDCRAVNIYGPGGFRYDRCIAFKAERCEAAGVQNGTNGDGFNAHSSNSGEIYSKQTTAILIACWSHDNRDDGYSDHERSEIAIFGGLFEYNGKGGVTPSYGSHCSCYNVVSRRNYNGFYYTGEASVQEGGKYGQLLCIDCYAEGNTNNAGFRVSGTGNRIELIHCISIGNPYGYSCTADSYVKLVDCYSKNNTQVKNGSNFTIVNTDLVT